MEITERSLFDRERELALAGDAFAEVEAGDGRTLLVEGPAGIGKSALLKAIAEDGRRRSFEVLLGRAGQYERDLPWGLVTDLFGPLLDSMDPDERQGLFTEAASLAAPLFGFASKAPATPNSLSAALHGLYWLTVGIADKYEKVVLAIDDLHWADEPSMRWLGRLAARIDELPVLIVATIRTSEPGAAEAAERFQTMAAESLRLGALTDQGSYSLVAELFDRGPAPEFATACHDATGGNPLLLRELIAGMRAAGTEPTVEASLHVPGFDSRSVSRSFLARLDRLSPGAQSLATGAAVLKSGPRVDEAAELMELAPEEAMKAADELIAAGLVDDSPELAFTHPIVENAVYENISRHRRSGLELRAARVTVTRGADPGQVASHLLAVEPAGDPWVVEQLRQAAEDAFEKGAPDVAVSYLGRALEERPPDGDPASIVFQMALAQFGAGVIPQSFESFERALKLSRTDEQRVEIGLRYARRQAILLTGQGVVIAEKARSGLEEGTALAARAEVEALSLSILHTGRFPSARARLFELRSENRTEDPQLLAAMAVAASASAEPIDDVTDLCRRALADGIGSFVAGADARFATLGYAMVGLSLAEHFDEAAEFMTEWIDAASRVGEPVVHAFASSFRSDLNYRRGRVVEAEADARSSVRLFTEAGVEFMTSNGWLAEALVERDEVDEGLEVLAGTYIPDQPVLWNHYVARFSRARARIAAGEFEAALEDLEPFDDPEAIVFDFVIQLPWRSTAAFCHDRLGNHDLARSLVADELRLVQSAQAPRAIGITQTVLGLVAEKDEAVPILREAVGTLETTEAVLEHARAEVGLGGALRRASQRREAREILRQGLDRARTCGGLRLARLAREELAAAGAKPRRDELRGRDALTASEHRVASLAAGDLTNAQIAQQLFVTRRTVETHLTHAYQKLDIRGREELAGAMAADRSSGSG